MLDSTGGQKGALAQMTGKAPGNSYSCGVILTVEGSIFNVEYCTRFTKTDMDYKLEHVDELYRRYNMSLSVGDIGDAFDLTHKLQRTHDDKFLASRASHRVTGHIKYSKDEWPKTIVFEKDYYISEVLGVIKRGKNKISI